MVQVQIDFPETLDKKIATYRLGKELKSKEQAVIEIIDFFFIQNPNLLVDLINSEDEG